MRRLACALAALLVAACSGAPRGGGDGGGGSGGSGGALDLAMSGPPDLSPRPIAGIACGNNTCTTTLELCCTGDNGASGSCQMVQNPSCGASEFACDGPEDCEPANPECCVSGGLAQCRQTGVCDTISGARFMCHTTADCAMFAPAAICHLAANSPYGICF